MPQVNRSISDLTYGIFAVKQWPMSIASDFLARCEAYIARTGMSDRAFGRAVLNNHQLIPRLRKRGHCTTAIIERVDSWMAAHPDGPPQKEGEAAFIGASQHQCLQRE